MTLAPETYTPKGRALPEPAKLTQVINSVTFSVGLYIAIVGTIIFGSYVGAQSMGYNWQWYRMPQYFYSFTDDGFQLGEFMIGLGKTIELSFTAFALAVIFGLIIALLRLSNLVIGRAVAVGFLEFIRNIPLLVLLYLFYYRRTCECLVTFIALVGSFPTVYPLMLYQIGRISEALITFITMIRASLFMPIPIIYLI